MWLIIEDIKTGSIHGTEIELAVLYPMILQLCTIPLTDDKVIEEDLTLYISCNGPTTEEGVYW